jgi:GTP-binding protein Era
MVENSNQFRCGYASIVGRPNVGKSTLLNRILGQKISITSHRPQTTRHRIVGIHTTDQYQAIYVDTPGLHLDQDKAMNRYLNRAASSAMNDVDVIVFVVDGLKWTDEDEWIMQRLSEQKTPVILVINKIDELEKETLLPHIQKLATKMQFHSVIPLSARSGSNVEALDQEVSQLLPLNPPVFPEDQVTDRSMRFLAAEIIREKLMRRLGQELPYALTVEIESYKEQDTIVHIHAIIWVERDGQKAIVIGKKGQVLKQIGQQAREDLEKQLAQKVFLKLWVKVKEGWSSDERVLRSLGYSDE